MAQLVQLGKNIDGKSITYYTDNTWGVCACYAKPRYGKSTLMRSIAVRMGQYRPLLAFGLYGREWRGLKHFNWNVIKPWCNPDYKTDRPMRLDDLKIVENPSFLISDFDRAEDWLSFGMPEATAKAVAEIACVEGAHNNEPERFAEVLKDLPCDELEEAVFVSKYKSVGLRPIRVFAQSKQSAIVRWQFLQHYFGAPREINHWGQYFIRHPHLLVDFDLRSDPVMGLWKARAFTAKILSQMTENLPNQKVSALEVLKPVIFIDEFDRLVPSGEIAAESSITNILLELGMKLQRYGVALFLISQSSQLVDERLRLMSHVKILGRVEKGVDGEEHTRHLRWHHPHYRQFVLIREDDTPAIFIPDHIPCL